MKTPEDTLKTRVKNAEVIVRPSSLWTNKFTGKTYLVVLIALRERDLQPVVVYGKGELFWTRPVKEFIERFEECAVSGDAR